MPPKRIQIRQSQRLQIASSQKYTCLQCNQTLGSIFNIDHKIALCLDGPDNLSNLCALCPNCHAEKTNDDMQKYWDIKKEEHTGKSKYFDPYSVFYIDTPFTSHSNNLDTPFMSNLNNLDKFKYSR
jgi:hypothetical protein